MFLKLMDSVVPSNCCVLIEGESGTGKELLARRLCAKSHRADKLLIPVNCAGISPSLFESQFFGHVRGAFTGAEQNMLGVIPVRPTAAPCFSTRCRNPHEPATEAAARHPGTRGDAHRQPGPDQGRCAVYRRHQPQFAGVGPAGRVSAGPVLSAEHRPRGSRTAAQAARGHPAPVGALHPLLCQTVPLRARSRERRRYAASSRPILGRGTSGNWRPGSSDCTPRDSIPRCSSRCCWSRPSRPARPAPWTGPTA